MENENRRGEQDQLEEHSLPGTNQAGKGSDQYEAADPENGPGHGQRRDGALEEHSLPGTNQAGKGPGSSEKND